MDYVLYIAGWYPSAVDAYSGDFVQRHAQCISLYHNVITLFITKSATHKQITIDKKVNDRLIEYIVYYPEKKFGDKILSPYYYNKVYKQIIKQILTTYGKPTLVHAYIAWKAGLVAMYIKKKYGLPYILTDQSSAYYTNDLNFVGKNKLRYRLIKKIFHNAQALITVSHLYYNNCSSLFAFEKPYFVIENCVATTSFFYESHHNKVPVLIHISTMDYPKNMEGLLRGVAQVKKMGYTFKLLLVGTPHNNISDLVTQLQLDDIVTMTGIVPYELVATHLRKSDGLLMFSRFEGLPCVILEALCSGVPVTSTAVGGIPEVINEANGMLVSEGDEEQFALKIVALLNNQTQYNNKLIAATATSLYSYEAIGKKFSEAYSKILEQATSS